MCSPDDEYAYTLYERGRFEIRMAMATLNAKQRMKLKSLAHHLKPILHIGKEGVTEATLGQIETAFNTRELLKIKVQDSAPDSTDESGVMIAARLDGVHLVQVIGRTIVLYRRHPEKPEIELPQARASSQKQ